MGAAVAIGQDQCRFLVDRLGKRIAENEALGNGNREKGIGAGSAYAELARARADAYRTALDDVLKAERGQLLAG